MSPTPTNPKLQKKATQKDVVSVRKQIGASKNITSSSVWESERERTANPRTTINRHGQGSRLGGFCKLQLCLRHTTLHSWSKDFRRLISSAVEKAPARGVAVTRSALKEGCKWVVWILSSTPLLLNRKDAKGAALTATRDGSYTNIKFCFNCAQHTLENCEVLCG